LIKVRVLNNQNIYLIAPHNLAASIFNLLWFVYNSQLDLWFLREYDEILLETAVMQEYIYAALIPVLENSGTAVQCLVWKTMSSSQISSI